MFARFRETQTTLQVTLLAGRRVDGRVRHELVATLGSIRLPMTIDGREAFWRRLHETLARLGNRIPADTQGKIMGQVHERIPMVTADQRREHEIGLAEREQKVWGALRDVFAEEAAGMEGVAASATATAAEGHRRANDVGTWATDAGERAERLRRGDDNVPRSEEIDFEKILREAGFSAAHLKHMKVLGALPRDAIPILRDISMAAGERACRAAARRMLRKLQEGE
jgi:hypothetical protein